MSSSDSSASRAALPPVDFQTLIISLGSSALMLMGTLPEPGGAPSEVNLPLAKHTIDTLAMLQEKTRGNLTAAETELLDGLIFDLRLKFIEANRRG
jgi:hypothetical protein